jgi:uncharacterized protein YciI
MFVILLKYVKPLDEVDRWVPEHRTFLERRYASGHFVMSGRQNPRVGGLIIAKAASRSEVEAIVAEDPFHREQVATYEIVEFAPTMTAPELAAFKVS